MQVEPLVCAVMLTKDRPQMAARAIRSFKAQTYQNAMLVIVDSADSHPPTFIDTRAIRLFWVESKLHPTIGALRNFGNRCAADFEAEIIIHWDDDDWSHPNRIAEQVADLQALGAHAVGYNDLLFWRTEMVCEAIELPDEGEWKRFTPGPIQHVNGQAWLYKGNPIFPPPGTSLCYWTKIWQQKQFADFPRAGSGTGEDYQWCKGLDVRPISSLRDKQPRMIASIHGGNTVSYDLESLIERGSLNWKHAPEWDEYCLERMKL